MGTVRFIRNEGGLGRPADGLDYVSGLAMFVDDLLLPSGFTTSDRVKPILSVQDAEALGIDDSHSDETPATGGNILITNAGTAGDVAFITVDEGDGAFRIAEYTIESGDAVNDVAAGLRADMNNLVKWSHGYTAGGSTANVAITVPSGIGALLNGAGLAFDKEPSGSTLAATVTQFTGGVDGFIDVIYYQVQEFFRANPTGKMWLGLYSDASFDATVVEQLQTAAGGECRQIAVFNQVSALASSQVQALEASATVIEGQYRPASVVYAADMTGLVLASQPNTTTLNSERVTVLITGDDRAGTRLVWNKKAFTVANIGRALGDISASAVHESIGDGGRVNISDGTQMEQVRLLPSTSYQNASDALIAQLDAYGYLFARKFTDVTGTFWNNDKTSVSSTSDYARIRNVRTMDKAVRLCRANIIPLLNSPVYVNSSGQLSPATIAMFKNECDKVIAGEFGSDTASGQMVIAGELSAGRTIINPNQNVLQNNEIQIAIELIPVGAAEGITVRIGFVAKFTLT